MAVTSVFILRNQAGLYLNKQNEWVDGSDSHSLFRAAYRDIAANTLFELTLKDVELRGEVIRCTPDGKGDPLLDKNAAANMSDDEDCLDEDDAEQAENADEEISISSRDQHDIQHSQ